jgi:hypothetical protein
VLILATLYFLLRFFAAINLKKISQSVRILLFTGLIVIAVLFAVGGKFLLTLPLTIISLALLKLKGLSIFQLISLYRLIQNLKNSGRFSFNNKNVSNSNTMSRDEAYKILNLDSQKKYTKDEILKSYKSIMKKIHPDVSPELNRLASIVNEAKEILIK